MCVVAQSKPFCSTGITRGGSLLTVFSTSSAAGTLLHGLLHALTKQRLEFRAELLRLALELIQKPSAFVVKLAVGEQHPAQPDGFLGIDPVIGQNVILDDLVEKLLEGRIGVLHAFVQFREEVDLFAADLAAGVQAFAQRFKVLTVDFACSQDVLCDFA